MKLEQIKIKSIRIFNQIDFDSLPINIEKINTKLKINFICDKNKNHPKWESCLNYRFFRSQVYWLS